MTAESTEAVPRNGWLGRVWSWFTYEPMRHAWWEALLFRAGIAWCAWQTLAGPLTFTSQPRPHGIAVWFDVTVGGDPKMMAVLSPLSAVCLLLYVFNLALPVTLLLPLFLSFTMGTLLNSQGAINHTTQIVTLVLLVQWLAALWSATGGRRKILTPNSFTDYQLAADWTRQAIMSTYVVSAISKLIESGGLWFADARYFGLQITKAAGMAKYGDTGSGHDVHWLAQAFIDHPLMATFFIAAALPLELFAFLGVLNRRLALFFGLSLFAFHSTVTEMMNLDFAFHKTLLLVLFVNPVWWVVQGTNWTMGSGRREEAQKPISLAVSGDKN
ncbi:MAG: hypothetical protein K8R87_11150 [Verrucomicrobia bacterium]|nr:hypothetical protein [Verrucomicrobiota bacterium]